MSSTTFDCALAIGGAAGQGIATPGNILAISNQPYVGYQNAVLQNLLPNTFGIETVGKSASPNIKITTALDTLARWLQQGYAFISSSP